MANEPGALVRSFEGDGRNVTTSSNGARAHALHQAHLERLHRRFYTVKPGVWCLVGNGLSNQTFIEAPEGIIAIDTGECVEEMRAALKELRAVTDKPVVAVMYTHFHYVGGIVRQVYVHRPVVILVQVFVAGISVHTMPSSLSVVHSGPAAFARSMAGV